MRARFISAVMGAAVSAAAGSGQASPPGSLYLVPKEYAPRVGAMVELSLRRGVGGGEGVEQGVAFESLASDWFFYRVAATQENRDSALLMNAAEKPGEGAPATGAKPGAPAGQEKAGDADKKGEARTMAVTFRADTPGGAMAGCDFTPRIERVEAGELRVFLKGVLTAAAYEEVAGSLPAQGEVRVRRVETVKAFLRIAGEDPAAPSDTQTPTSKAGQVNELRFLFDPTRAAVGSDVPLRVFMNFDKVALARVTVACDEAKVSQPVETDATGTATFTVSHEGVWRVEAHHARAIKGDADADLALWSATAIFRSAQKEAAR